MYDCLEDLADSLEKGRQNDAHELLQCLLAKLHEEFISFKPIQTKLLSLAIEELLVHLIFYK